MRAMPIRGPQSDPTRHALRHRIAEAVGDRLVAVILHGSRAKGRARLHSDWDVVVVLRDPIYDWIEESLQLAALFYDCPFAVDLQVYAESEFHDDADVPGTLAYAVSRRGELLYGTPEALTDSKSGAGGGVTDTTSRRSSVRSGHR